MMEVSRQLMIFNDYNVRLERKGGKFMNIEDMLEINDCPLCDGGALLEEECGCGYYVMCLECGCHSVTIDFHSEEERLDAARRTVMLWNTGKVISSSPGE